MATLNIREFGATPDDGTDDTAAIQHALDAATEGDTVYVPVGTYHVRGADPSAPGATALELDRNRHPDNLTIEGDGYDSHIKLLGTHSEDHFLFRVYVRDGFTGLQIRQLRLDGNRSEQTAVDGGHTLHFGGQNAGHWNDIRVEHCWLLNGNQSNLVTWTNGLTAVNVTANDAGSDHGISYHGNEDADNRGVFKNCYASGNNIYGIDCSEGHVLVEDCVFENNGWGSKSTSDHREAVYRRVRFKNNEYFGYQRIPIEGSFRSDVTFEDCIAEGNGWAGFKFSTDADFNVGTIVATGNNSTGKSGGNINIDHDANVSATDVYSCDAVQGAGIRSITSGSVSVGTYTHSGNAEGSFSGDSSSINISNDVTDDAPNLDVPTASDVGAGASSGPNATIRTSSGTFASKNGVIETL
jgi:hypothetical protein